MDLDGRPTQNFAAVRKGRESVVDVPHVPMKPLGVLVSGNVLVELLKHRLFKAIILLLDGGVSDASPLGHLMDRKGSGLPTCEVAYGVDVIRGDEPSGRS